jgi:hypothetical protein
LPNNNFQKRPEYRSDIKETPQKAITISYWLGARTLLDGPRAVLFLCLRSPVDAAAPAGTTAYAGT